MKKITILILAFALSGCDQFTWFQSEGKIKKRIQHTWKRQFLEITNYEEDWIFNDGKVTLVQIFTNITDTVDEASYKIDANWLSACVKIEGFDADSTVVEYNRNWTIVELDDHVLYIAADAGIQREFVRKD
jgi:hypothetical protein